MRETPVTPVAVVGMACSLPGGIDSPELLREALLRGHDLITEIPPERWDAHEHYDPEPGVPGRSVSRWGGFLNLGTSAARCTLSWQMAQTASLLSRGLT